MAVDMKIRYFMFSLAALTLWGCAQTTLRPGPDGDALRAVIIEEDPVGTKAQLLDVPGIRLESVWQAGDRIGVFGTDAANVAFQVAEDDLSKDRKTADFRTDGAIPSGKLTAYSPWQQGASSADGAILVDFPATQHYLSVDGVAAPDPDANILVAAGSKGGGLDFRSVLAVLKIGQVFEEETLVRRVEFRDLSGAPVAGEMKITPGTSPTAEITGNGQVLTLDLGAGQIYAPGAMRPLFLIVPAREYAQGFEITFVDDKGGKTVRTIGKTGGKTLVRGAVYPVGEITTRDYPVGTKTEWNEGTILLAPDAMEKIRVVDVYENRVLVDDNGNPCYDVHGYQIYAKRLDLLVHKDLHPAVGKWLVFDHPTEMLPDGGVYKILSCEPQGEEYYSVYAEVDRNVFAPIKSLTVGDEIFDAEGNVIEGAGIDLDLASHLASIHDEHGNPIPFTIGPSGQVLLSDEDTAELLGLEQPATKAKWQGTFSAPKMSFKHSEDHAEVTFGAQLLLGTKFYICVADGSLQSLHFNINPRFELSADFVMKQEVSVDWPFHLITLNFTPIMIAPGVLISPTMELRGEIGLGGTIQFSSSVKYTYDMGTFGMSYGAGTGFIGRRNVAEPSEMEVTPEVGDVTGQLYAYGKLTAAPYLSVYGLLGLGLEADFTLKFGIEGSTGAPTRLFLAPELALVPSVATLGGLFTHRFSDFELNVEFKPIWERYLAPVVELREPLVPIGQVKHIESYYYMVGGEKRYRWAQFGEDDIATRVDGMSYDLASTVKTLDPWTVALDVYELTMDASVRWRDLILTPSSRDRARLQPWSYWEIPSEKVLSSQRVGRFELMDIPAAQFNEKTASGVAAQTAFSNGKVYTWALVYINKANGKELKAGERNYHVYQRYRICGDDYDWNATESRGWGIENFIFGVYWPETPDGPYWVSVDDPYDADKFVQKPRSYEEELGHEYFTGISWEAN